jgi:predicted RNA-binding Zn-ribbon protein involved in translation (DUF1610 family)
MDALILLEKFRTLLSAAPPLERRGSYEQEQFAWLGRASALISTWDRSETIYFNTAVNGMTGNFNRVANHGIVFTMIHKAIASLEDQLPSPSGQAFGPGAAYDFFKALRELISTAEKIVLLVDPYMDTEIFDGFIKKQVAVVFSNNDVQKIIEALKVGVMPKGLIKSFQTRQTHLDSLEARHNSTTTCPKCGSERVLRKAKSGANAGKEFYGCSSFPKCRFMKPAPAKTACRLRCGYRRP